MFCGAFRMAATVLSILATPSMVSVSVPCAAHASDAGRGDRASRQKTGEKFAPVETSAIKTVAAFLNSYDGGSQLLGVAEDGGGRGVPFGLELDYLTVRKPDNGDGDMFGPNTTAPRMRRPASPRRSGSAFPDSKIETPTSSTRSATCPATIPTTLLLRSHAAGSPASPNKPVPPSVTDAADHPTIARTAGRRSRLRPQRRSSPRSVTRSVGPPVSSNRQARAS